MGKVGMASQPAWVGRKQRCQLVGSPWCVSFRCSGCAATKQNVSIGGSQPMRDIERCARRKPRL
jgi:hypothetical protein